MYLDSDRYDTYSQVLGANGHYRDTNYGDLPIDLNLLPGPTRPMTPGSTDTGFAHIQLAAHSLLRPEAGLSPLRLPREEDAAHALLDLHQQPGPVRGDREASWVSHGQPALRMLTGHTNPSCPPVPHPACTGDQAQGDYLDHFPGQGDEGRQNPGYQTSGMSTSLGRHAPPSVYQGRERRYCLIPGDAGPPSPSHQTFDMSAGLARSALPPETPPRQAVGSAHAESTQGRQDVHSAPAGYSYMRTDTSVLELAGFDGPTSDTVPRKEPCRSSWGMWLESAAETHPVHRVMNMRTWKTRQCMNAWSLGILMRGPGRHMTYPKVVDTRVGQAE